MSTLKPTCGARIFIGNWGASRVCGRTAAYEHEGHVFCKMHHPPTIQAKQEASRAKYRAEWEAKQRAAQVRGAEIALQTKRAELFPALLALLVESQTSIGGDWRERRDALIARAQEEGAAP